jgi:murein DD-endopeptidase MepM/ murein hydrolase activator NlpD
MAKWTYRYNPETCQYERIGISVRGVLFYFVSVLLTAVVMLAAMLTLHDVIFDSEKEIALRRENSAYEKNQIVLASQLSAIESSLATLHEEDQKLHTKFFGSQIEAREQKSKGLANRQVLLADPSDFRSVIEKIDGHSSTLLTQSVTTNSFFGDRATLHKDQVSFVASIPTLQPVLPWDVEKLLSGFGVRVNPFHKGLYEHPGIDVAFPRGTEVVATSSGTITEVKRSNLQAGYGNYVEIDHGHGFRTRYAHLEDIRVKYGQRVEQGTVIATIGSSGGSIAPHLHYEIIRDGQQVDPVLYMIEGLSSADHHKMKILGQQQNQSLD